MVRCESCFQNYDENIAAGVCPHCGHYEGKEQDDPRYLPIGYVLHERYVLGRAIGAGGFGITYIAWDKKHNVRRAIKEYFQQGVVNRIPGSDFVFVSAPKRQEEFLYGKERLLREAQIVAKFQSESIVKINDYFEDNNTSYIVMEYLDLPTLQEYLLERKQVLEVDQAIEIGVKLCAALDEIHKAGVIHKDISPDNIFIGPDNKVKIIDFGSAKLSADDFDDRLIAVKPGYAPPEQYEKEDAENVRQQAWTDVYALGATLYTVLTGHVPAESSERKADYHNDTDRVCYPRELNSNIPEYLDNAIMTAMAVNIHERFQSAEAFKQALLQERKVLPIETVRKRKKIRRTAGIGVGFLGVAILIGLGIWKYTEPIADIVLDEAHLDVWYSVDSQDSGEKEAVLQGIIEDAKSSDVFQNITFELKAIPESEYSQELKNAYQAGNMPEIFENTNGYVDYASDSANYDDIFGQLALKDKLFLEDYVKELTAEKRIPTGFQVPVIYLNTSIAADYTEGDVIDSMEALQKLADGQMKYLPMAINEDIRPLFEEMYSDFSLCSAQLEGNTKESFLEGQAVVYFSDTSDFFMIRDALAGKFVMIPVSSKSVLCQFTNYWSIGECGIAESDAAERLIAYFIENNAQDKYYLQSSNAGLPLDKVALDGYKDVRRQFEVILSEIERFKIGE